MLKSDDREPYTFSEYKLAAGLCLAFAEDCDVASIAYGIGTGGSRKTSLSKYIARVAFGEADTWPLGTRPVIWVEADLPDRSYFSSKSLMRALLKALYDPFRASAIEVMGWDVPDETKLALAKAVADCRPDDDSEPDLRAAFIGLAKLMGVKLIIIDEANLLVLTQKGRVPTDYVESLRVLASKVGCALMLFGTVDMLQLMGHSGQVNRRNMEILLDRMRCETTEGKQEFFEFLSHIEEDYGLPEGLLSDHLTEIYGATYAIPGEVVGLVARADKRRRALKLDVLDWSLIERCFHNLIKLRTMKEESDVIYKVINGLPLSQDEEKIVQKRKKSSRMKPTRRAVGA